MEPDWNKRIFVANPASFDKMWCDYLFAVTKHDPAPYHYRSLCLRSMKFGLAPETTYGSDRTTHKSTVEHHAYYDALAQAKDLIDMLKTKKERG